MTRERSGPEPVPLAPCCCSWGAAAVSPGSAELGAWPSGVEALRTAFGSVLLAAASSVTRFHNAFSKKWAFLSEYLVSILKIHPAAALTCIGRLCSPLLSADLLVVPHGIPHGFACDQPHKSGSFFSPLP